MAAIITNRLKKQIIQSLFNDVQDSDSRYYIGIGRSEDWDSSDTAPSPSNTQRDIRNFRAGVQSIKASEDISFVVPRYNWSSGTTYSSWNDYTQNTQANPYYVVTDNNTVYMCIKTGRDATGAAVASTIQPSGSLPRPFKTADGYVWKFLYTISAAQASKFLSANYIPVQFISTTDSDSPANEVEQKSIQDAAIAGQLANILVTNGGSGYTSAPSVTVFGDGDSAEARARVSGGVVVSIEIDSNGSGVMNYGNSYNQASISITGGGGTGATARPIFAPTAGLGADPRDDLKSTGIMFNTKPNGTETGTFIVDNDFRQVGLIKNPTKTLTDSDFSVGSGLVLRTMRLGTISQGFTPDRTIQGGTSFAQAIVDYFDSDTLYYHQNEDTGFRVFTDGEAIDETDGNGAGIADSAEIVGTVNRFSGEVLYIENRAAVDRAADQSEDIKVIIQI